MVTPEVVAVDDKLILAFWPIVGRFLSEFLKGTWFEGRIVPINMLAGALLAGALMGWSIETVFLGAAVGSGAAGVYNLTRKKKRDEIHGI